MKKTFKLLSVVVVLTIFSSAYGVEKSHKFSNPQFSQLKKSMWFSGVNNISMGEVPGMDLMEENYESQERVELPEELTRPLLKRVSM